MLNATMSKDGTRVASSLRPWEWGPAKNDSGDPRNPEAIARLLDLVVDRAGRPDDN